MFSYILLLVFAFVIASGISTTVVRNRFTRQAKSELTAQGEALVEYIATARVDLSEPRKLLAYLRNTNNSGVVPYDTFIITTKRQIAYASNPDISQLVLNNLPNMVNNQGSNSGYIYFKQELESDDDRLGTLLLVSEVRHIETSVKTLRNALIMSMFIALVIGSIIATVMRSKIVKPIKSLRDDIVMATKDSEHIVRPVKTNDEIEELYMAFNEMNTTINAHMDERKRFFQNASHELKTPLMSIQGYAEAIRDGVMEGDEVDNSLDIIIRKSQQLKKTVEEIIYLSKLMNQDFEYKFESVDLVRMIHTALTDQSVVASEEGIELILECEPESVMLELDDVKFASVLENLLSNALRYAKSLVKVAVSDEATRTIIRVMDDGKGLRAGEESKVFERFYKGEGGNSGIGLAIVQEIIRHHDGEIRAGNHISGGAVFEVTIRK